MRELEPDSPLGQQRQRAREVRALLTGREIVAVTYVAPGSAGDDHGPAMGIEFETDTGSVAITWAMDGTCEGLAMGAGRVDALRRFEMDLQRRDASDMSWAPFVGRPIEHVSFRWQESNEGCPATVWAIDLDFGDDLVVVALGEMFEDGPRYMPDEMIAVFGRAAAAAYAIPAAVTDFTMEAHETRPVLALLLDVAPEFSRAPELLELDTEGRDLTTIVCGAFGRYLGRMLLSGEPTSVETSAAVAAAEALANNADPDVVNGLVVGTLHALESQSEPSSAVSTMLGPETRRLYDRWTRS